MDPNYRDAALVSRCSPGRSCGCPGLGVQVVPDQAFSLEGVQPAAHRPPAPSSVEDGRVANDVLQVLPGRVGYGVVLVVGPCAAHPGEGDAVAGGDLAEVGVFRAVAAVLLAEP